MPLTRLLLVLLVLLQSGLAAARVHAHPDGEDHTAAPHVHTGDLLDLFGTPGHDHEGEDDHDTDAIDLSAALAPATHADDGAAAVDCAPPLVCKLTLRQSDRTPAAHPPRPAAGPPRPLYLTFCALTI